jgi:hypothetical protein
MAKARLECRDVVTADDAMVNTVVIVLGNISTYAGESF